MGEFIWNFLVGFALGYLGASLLVSLLDRLNRRS